VTIPEKKGQTPPWEPDWIGLALSGGGFRATLFHLGVIRFLFERQLLRKVKIICSVSGGSILAAHLGLGWKSYTGSDADFQEVANSLIGFTQSDLRGRITRRWLCGTALLLPRIIRLWSFSNLLRQYYSSFYASVRSDALKSSSEPTLAMLRPTSDQPEIHILATSLTTGNLCKFTAEGFVWLDRDEPELVRHTSLPVSLAVASSSAFPPLFPPIEITKDLLGAQGERFHQTQYLTDGGVFDNLGLGELARLTQRLPRDFFPTEKGLLVISDAGGVFDWQDKTYGSLVARNIRASDILMDRVTNLVRISGTQTASKRCVIDIAAEIDPALDSMALAPQVQRAVANIRTDLDRFSNEEVRALLTHGYAQARVSFRNCGIESETASGWASIGLQESEQVEKKTVRELRSQDARRRRWGLISTSDWASGLLLIVLLLWLITLIVVPVRVTNWVAPYLLRTDFVVPTKTVQVLDDFVFVKFDGYLDRSGAAEPIEIYNDPESSNKYRVFDKATYVEHVSLRKTKEEYDIILSSGGMTEIRSIFPEPSSLHASEGEPRTVLKFKPADLEPEERNKSFAFRVTPDVKAIYVYRNGFQGENSFGGKNVIYDTDRLTFVFDFSSIKGWRNLFRRDPGACRGDVKGLQQPKPEFNWDPNAGIATLVASNLKVGDRVRIFWTWNRAANLEPFKVVSCAHALR
jgi:predicted acylesterase/phospholipase RssA